MRRAGQLGVLVALVCLVANAWGEPRRPSLCAIKHPSDARIEWTCHRLRRGESLQRLFGTRWIAVARFNRIDRRHAVPGIDLKVPTRLEDLDDFDPMPAEYPPAAGEARFVLIDLAEQFLGAYESGRRVFSAPIAAGEAGHDTPTGDFRITAVDPARRSSLYFINGTSTPYPMNYALRFHVDDEDVALWIHGRDLPGYAASHGCVGLYDEAMQRKFYGWPRDPILADARRLYEWVVGHPADQDGAQPFHGPRVRILGTAARADA